MAVPTVTSDELSNAIDDPVNSERTKKVLTGLLNDYMDLMYNKETPYTTGKQIIPSESTFEDVDNAIDETTEKKFRDIFVKISDTNKSGDFTPQSANVNNWDPKLKPVFVFVTSNPLDDYE